MKVFMAMHGSNYDDDYSYLNFSEIKMFSLVVSNQKKSGNLKIKFLCFMWLDFSLCLCTLYLFLLLHKC